MAAALDLVRENLCVESIYDVGAARGEFSKMCFERWPEATYFLFEPLTEFRESLATVSRQLGGATVSEFALLDFEGEIEINVHPDLEGSSVFLEIEGEIVNGEPRSVPCATLDSWFVPSAYRLVKLDVQGAELRVLDGAASFFGTQDGLGQGETIFIVEVNLFENMLGSDNIFATVVRYFNDRDYSLYDIAGLCRRPIDGALAQADLVFCHSKSVLRRQKAFASPAQRLKQFGLSE